VITDTAAAVEAVTATKKRFSLTQLSALVVLIPHHRIIVLLSTQQQYQLSPP